MPQSPEPSSTPQPTPTPPTPNVWTQRLTGGWHQATDKVMQILPVDKAAQTVSNWFRVDETQVAEILATVRAQLPTTEALLIGKPQAGKSSIVRGLTGVSAEIVGQGFRPHTQSTTRYNYPSSELPLLVFTDTVGLGDIDRDTNTLIQELIGDLEAETSRPRIIILTVKINDFAIDTLRQIARELRQKYPQIPCLLAVTCLHEVYPTTQTEHPDEPISIEAVDRAFTGIQQAFVGLFDRAVLIDFTLAEDGYTPEFYGLETMRTTLADLLPEAESRAMSQLLDSGKSTSDGESDKLGNIYRDVARRYILPCAIAAGAVAAIPLPFADLPVLTAIQVSMVGLLGKLYGQTLTPSQAGGVVSAIAGGFVAQLIARQLIKFIPGFGSVISASWAAAYTVALGEGACVYFGDLMGGKKPDPQQIQAVMAAAFSSAKEQFRVS
ncbi:YcjF family protein [Chamaesiphon sp. VAR_48_metabat_403]|uniref:YcjF family protein n=1 Tax=Chamaesiphon sp. VAR_48_metabat_403 TaxID=2964700 RepID=UPI0037C134A9